MLLIFDGNNMAYRAKYSMVLSHPSTDVDVSITYGVLMAMLATMRKFNPDSVMVMWDGGIPKFRRLATPEYKANRVVDRDEDKKSYEDFVRQMKELEEILPTFGIVSARKRYCEADDLMYHAAKMYNGKSIIVTTDRDLLQALDENISVYNPAKEVMYTPELVEEETGIPLEMYVDWRAIQGDGSDNIPGVRGIGGKTATKLLNKFGTLSRITKVAGGDEDGISDKMKVVINEFGLGRIMTNYYTMSLEHDRIGAKMEILEAVECYELWDRKAVKKYFISQSFMSLMNPDTMIALAKLKKPNMNYNSFRIPIIQEVRWPT